jgi:hypothetical protein
LELHWDIPPTDTLFASTPTSYLSHLLGHEGAGSAFALLKAKGWATALVAGGYRGGRLREEEGVGCVQVRQNRAFTPVCSTHPGSPCHMVDLNTLQHLFIYSSLINPLHLPSPPFSTHTVHHLPPPSLPPTHPPIHCCHASLQVRAATA